jgi:hypothetical protein
MKSGTSILAAFLLSIVLVEIVTKFGIGYPSVNNRVVEYNIDDMLRPLNTITVYPAHHSSWSVEGGAKAITRNNLGFTGIDAPMDYTEDVVLLGDSYLEALQYYGEQISAGILQEKFNQAGNRKRVINLGRADHDPYVLWYRLKFFERLYRVGQVVLVCEDFKRLQIGFKRWTYPLVFDAERSVGAVREKGSLERWADKIRSHSAFLTLTTRLYMMATQNSLERSDPMKAVFINFPRDKAYTMLLDCLSRFSEEYGDKFYFVSLMRDNPYQDQLKNWCREKGIKYFSNPVIKQRSNLIKGDGHFNLAGNKLLGDYLYEILTTE